MNTEFKDKQSNQQPDQLDALFAKARTTEPYLKDDGFSDGVISNLTARRGKRLSNSTKNTLIIGSALLGSTCAATMMSGIQLPVSQWISQIPSISLGIPALAAVALGLFAIAGTALWASYKEWI